MAKGTIKIANPTSDRFMDMLAHNVIDDNTIYFLSGASNIYLGGEEMTKPVILYTGELPTTDMTLDKLYFNKSTRNIDIYESATKSWINMGLGCVDEINTTSPQDNPVSAKAVVAYCDFLTNGGGSGEITLTSSNATISTIRTSSTAYNIAVNISTANNNILNINEGLYVPAPDDRMTKKTTSDTVNQILIQSSNMETVDGVSYYDCIASGYNIANVLSGITDNSRYVPTLNLVYNVINSTLNDVIIVDTLGLNYELPRYNRAISEMVFHEIGASRTFTYTDGEGLICNFGESYSTIIEFMYKPDSTPDYYNAIYSKPIFNGNILLDLYTNNIYYDTISGDRICMSSIVDPSNNNIYDENTLHKIYFNTSTVNDVIDNLNTLSYTKSIYDSVEDGKLLAGSSIGINTKNFDISDFIISGCRVPMVSSIDETTETYSGYIAPITLASAVFTENGENLENIANRSSRGTIKAVTVTATENQQSVFSIPIPIDDFFEDTSNYMEIRLGSLFLDSSRYTINTNTQTIAITDSEYYIDLGRDLIFIFYYNTPATYENKTEYINIYNGTLETNHVYKLTTDTSMNLTLPSVINTSITNNITIYAEMGSSANITIANAINNVSISGASSTIIKCEAMPQTGKWIVSYVSA